MALPAIGQASYPSTAEVRDAILRVIRYGALRRGIEYNVLPGSDAYIRAEATAARVAIAIANNQIALQNFSPLEATGDALENICGIFGVARRPASKASGNVIIQTNGTVTIPSGFQCTSAAGLKYETVSTSLAVGNGAIIAVRAVTAGVDTNIDAGAQLTWDSASIGLLKPTCTVASGDIDGGLDADDDETLRQRLVDRLSFPASGGNVAQVKAWAESATAAIERAYVYAAVRGPASYDVAVTKAGTDRTLAATTVALAAAAVVDAHPGHADVNVTAIAAQRMDIVLSATLPLPTNAGGAGGGWRDAAPWPAGSFTAGANDGAVTAYVAPTATVRTTATPVVGQRIAIWAPGDDEGEFNEYTVATVGGGAGAWTITVEGGFLVTPLNCYVSAGAVNIAQYGAEFLAQMRLLGPGEKTTNVDILPRGRRYPGADVSTPSDLTNQLLSPLMTEHPELLDLAYTARFITGTTSTQTAPSVPATTADPPRLFVLKHFAIRKA